jgi:hypothetical protein
MVGYVCPVGFLRPLLIPFPAHSFANSLDLRRGHALITFQGDQDAVFEYLQDKEIKPDTKKIHIELSKHQDVMQHFSFWLFLTFFHQLSFHQDELWNFPVKVPHYQETFFLL